MERYKYGRIRPTEQIRLLTILPLASSDINAGSAEIRCHLDEFDRDDVPQYEALSYTWGQGDRTASIVCNSRTVTVTQNCLRALKALRARYAAQTKPERSPLRSKLFSHNRNDSGAAPLPKLWIDAICINQDDHRERSGQVTIMGAIFQNAFRTLVYLGELEDQNYSVGSWTAYALRDFTLQTLETIRRIERLVSRQGDMGDDSPNLAVLKGIVKDHVKIAQHWIYFFAQPWFSRSWVVQESLLSKELVLLLGDVVLDWESVKIFARVPEQLIRHASSLGHSNPQLIIDRYSDAIFSKPLVVDSLQMTWPAAWNEQSEPDDRYCVSNGTTDLVTLSSVWSPGPPSFLAPRMLFSLLERSANLDCRDPRDKLFALLTLFESTPPTEVAVNYAKASSQVYIDLSWYLVSHGVLEILSLAKGITNGGMASLPSWVVDWTSHPRPRRLALNLHAGIPAEPSATSAADVVVKRTGNALILRGRLLEDTVDSIDDKPTGKVAWYRGFRTKSGINGIGHPYMLKDDVPCLFKGYDMPILLRSRNSDETSVVDWQIVGECWLRYDQLSANRPGYDMDWSHTFPFSTQSGRQDIWIY